MIVNEGDCQHFSIQSGKNNLDDKMAKRAKELNQNEKVVRSSMRMVTSRPENELFYKEKLNLTLRNFRGTLKHIENDIIQSKCITNWPLTLQKGNKSCNPLWSNVVESGQSSRKEEIDHNQWLISPYLLQWRNLQIHPMEMPHPNNNIFLNDVKGNSFVTIAQRNQRSMKDVERGPSAYVPPMSIVEMSRNHHERIYPQTQNRVLSWSNPLSTNFHSLDTNVNVDFGFLRGRTMMAQQQFNLSNIVQVSSPVSSGWGLQHAVLLPTTQNIMLQPDNSQNYHNQKNHKSGQADPGSLQNGRTISDIKTMDLERSEHMRTKGMKSLNSFSSEDMSQTQLLRQQERPFAPCNFHPPFCMDGKSDQVLSPRSQEKKRKAHAPAQFSRRKFQQYTSSNSLMRSTRDPSPKVDPMPDYNVSKSIDMGGCSISAAIFSVSSIAKMDPPCLLNQNPADIADTNDERYLRTVDDQRIQENFGAVVKLDGRQRQRRKERPGRMHVID